MLVEKVSIVALATALAGVRATDGSSFTRVYAALDEVEQLLFRHKDAFGVHNALFQQGCEEFVLLCNTAAIKHLPRVAAAPDSEEFRQCGDLLARVEQHTRRSGYLKSVPSDRHVTGRVQLRLLSLNNLACFHKQTGKPLAAIVFLEEALEIQLRQLHEDDDQEPCASEDASENAIALTHLNLSAVLSQMKRHDAAAEHARSAIDLLRRAHAHGAVAVDANLLVVAHYNLAVEYEHLGGDAARVLSTVDKGIAAAQRLGLDSGSSEVLRLLEGMRRTTKAPKSPRHALPPRVMRPPSPRTLRQRGW